MHIRNYNFSLSDITLDMNIIAKLIGDFKSETLPDPYPDMISSEIEILNSCVNIQGGYLIQEKFKIDQIQHTLNVNGILFKPGYQVIKDIRDSEKLAFYVCTAGEGISLRSKELFNKGMFLEGYITDLLGSVIVGAAMDLIHSALKNNMLKENLSVSNRYSPGYCNWNVEEQHKLFSLFPQAFCSVTLTNSALMYPVKSVSGVIGIGRNIEYHKYICDACSNINCIYRNIRDY